MAAGTERVLADAAARGVPVELVERRPASNLDEAAEQLGVTPAELVKTLVVKRGEHDYLLALVPGDRRLAWPKLRALVGANRLRLADADEALAATGYERGTITPFGALGGWPVVADASIVGRRISMGAGEHGCGLWVDADALIAGYDATVADVTEAADG